jgi:uncharacterized GH25 family protein
MKSLVAGLCVLVGAGPACAHFIWIIPDESANRVSVVFSETPAPDSPALLDKISHMQLMARNSNGRAEPLKFTKSDDVLRAEVSADNTRTIGGVCTYGVMKRGNTEPFLLVYHARTCVTKKGEKAATTDSEPWDRLALDIVPDKTKPGTFRVLWNGKPLKDAEVVAVSPESDEPSKLKTDSTGTFLTDLSKPGLYGFRVRHIEPTSGEHDGNPYKEVRHYSTLVVRGSAK